MTLLIFLFSGVGEWIEANPVVVGGFLVHVILVSIWLAKLQWNITDLRRGYAEMTDHMATADDRVGQHVTDGDMHVNQLYMGTISKRLDNIENEVKTGHEQIRNQIDKKFDALAVRMNK